MRIAFLCGSLEPGRDGVGDYARLLAGECVRQGHKCSLTALHDRHLTDAAWSDDSCSIPVLRLPAAMPWRERIERAAAFRKQFEPDIISLQFVPYAFNDKGIVWDLGAHLAPIVEGHRTHIMFHELWLGLPESARRKDRLVGAVQKLFILHTARSLRPSVVHTNTSASVEILGRSGVRATLLLLFGNIPVGTQNADDWLLDELATAGIAINRENRESFWLFGIFGSIYPEWNPEPLLTCIHEAASKGGRTALMLAIGHNRTGGRERWEAISRQCSAKALFHDLGPRSPGRLSQILNSLDFGISASPWALVGKSGGTAAMLEHGLPVIVNRDDVKFRGLRCAEDAEPGLLKLDASLPQRLQGIRRREARSRLPEVARQFVDDWRRIAPTG